MKMPRGNKEHIMRYAIPSISLDEQRDLMGIVTGYETIILDAKAAMEACAAHKQAILARHLK